ncbi:MAG: hypothetical protein ACI33S_05800 [Bacilli bacterium]
MKKILIVILCLVMGICSVKAECTDTEILKWAKEVEVKFETSENIPNAEYLYYLYLEPSRDDIEIRSTNSLYSGVTKGAVQENGRYGIASYIHFEEKTYTLEVYMKKDAKVCAGEQILKLRKTVPQYNSYSNTAYCYEYPEAELCQTMSDTDDISQEEFIKQMEEYIESKVHKEEPKKENIILTIIFDYLIWIIIPALLIGIFYKIRINKVRREKDAK